MELKMKILKKIDVKESFNIEASSRKLFGVDFYINESIRATERSELI